MAASNGSPLAALPVHHCPLCGGPNGCAPAISGDLSSPCWCTQVAIPAEVLARVPEHLRNKACICRACATMTSTGKPA